MSKAKWFNITKRSAILMLVLSCLCALTIVPDAFAESTEIPVQSEEYKKGQALANEGKRAEARAIYESGAEKGDAWCIFELGDYYFSGLGGLQKDEQRSIALLNKAADLNIPAANYYLGNYCLNGSYGVPQDLKKGIELMTRAAELNYPEAYTVLGLCYLEQRHGVSLDTKKGIELMTKAADLNEPYSLYYLSIYYANGEYGLTKDAQKGAELTTKSAELNLPDAVFRLGNLHLTGYGVPKNNRKGIDLIRKAVDLNYPAACTLLGISYLEGRFDVQKDITTGIALTTRAARLGDPAGLYNLGLFNLNGRFGIPKDTEKGLTLLIAAANQDYPAALCYLGKKFLEGDGSFLKDVIKGAAELVPYVAESFENYLRQENGVPTSYQGNKPGLITQASKVVPYAVKWILGDDGSFTKDTEKGLAFLTRAAELNYPAAMYALGNCYEKGTGVEQNYMIALYHYKRAKEFGMTGKEIDESIRRMENPHR